jgi:hypothetical protein
MILLNLCLDEMILISLIESFRSILYDVISFGDALYH